MGQLRCTNQPTESHEFVDCLDLKPAPADAVVPLGWAGLPRASRVATRAFGHRHRHLSGRPLPVRAVHGAADMLMLLAGAVTYPLLLAGAVTYPLLLVGYRLAPRAPGVRDRRRSGRRARRNLADPAAMGCH
jgi:hypothetical protein